MSFDAIASSMHVNIYFVDGHVMLCNGSCSGVCHYKTLLLVLDCMQHRCSSTSADMVKSSTVSSWKTKWQESREGLVLWLSGTLCVWKLYCYVDLMFLMDVRYVCYNARRFPFSGMLYKLDMGLVCTKITLFYTEINDHYCNRYHHYYSPCVQCPLWGDYAPQMKGSVSSFFASIGRAETSDVILVSFCRAR